MMTRGGARRFFFFLRGFLEGFEKFAPVAAIRPQHLLHHRYSPHHALHRRHLHPRRKPPPAPLRIAPAPAAPIHRLHHPPRQHAPHLNRASHRRQRDPVALPRASSRRHGMRRKKALESSAGTPRTPHDEVPVAPRGAPREEVEDRELEHRATRLQLLIDLLPAKPPRGRFIGATAGARGVRELPAVRLGSVAGECGLAVDGEVVRQCVERPMQDAVFPRAAVLSELREGRGGARIAGGDRGEGDGAGRGREEDVGHFHELRELREEFRRRDFLRLSREKKNARFSGPPPRQ
mmetsp:Transcript_29504/g.74132  ORF Transcript_29504/g.74132 Transcript_29504/m.74132 type:complete len:292 (+) Transcript_29504:243-1118(+)